MEQQPQRRQLHLAASRQTAPASTTSPTGALKSFTDRYGKAAAITKDDIFAYVYAVLHDPVYRETYALNLKREFPRIPLYPDFRRWRDWGQALLDLHIGYQAVEPHPLTRTDAPDPKRCLLYTSPSPRD